MTILLTLITFLILQKVRMNTKTENYHIEVRDLSIEVIRKDIKHFYIGVHPPNGQVRVSAPLRLDDDAVRMAIVSRLGWIRRKQTAFMNQERQSEREYVSGESHYFAGKRYRLKVTEQDRPPTVRLLNNTRIGFTSYVQGQIGINVRQYFMNGIVNISAHNCHHSLPNGNKRWS